MRSFIRIISRLLFGWGVLSLTAVACVYLRSPQAGASYARSLWHDLRSFFSEEDPAIVKARQRSGELEKDRERLQGLLDSTSREFAASKAAQSAAEMLAELRSGEVEALKRQLAASTKEGVYGSGPYSVLLHPGQIVALPARLGDLELMKVRADGFVAMIGDAQWLVTFGQRMEIGPPGRSACFTGELDGGAVHFVIEP